MGADQHNDWRDAAASALEWWADAGVSTLVEDSVRDWFARPAPAAAPPSAQTRPAAEGSDALPTDLTSFLAWRLGPAAPEAGWGTPLVAPEGDPGAELMVFVDRPEQGALAGGAAGRLLDRMLAAIGRSRDTIYLAGFACAEPLSGAVPADAEDELARLALHLAGLSGANRLLILSKQVSRALIGTSRAPLRGVLHGINQGGREWEAVASVHPRFLLESPMHKAAAWKDLQLLLRGKRS